MSHSRTTLGVLPPDLVIRSVQRSDEPALERFVLAHPAHGPGHRRAFARMDVASGLSAQAVLAERSGRVVGYASSVVMETRVVRVLRARNASGGSLVACGPLTDPALDEPTAQAVMRALLEALRRQARAAGALRLRFILPPMSGDTPTHSVLTSTHPLVAGATRGGVPGPVLDLALEESTLWNELAATTRNLIRRAQKDGLRARSLTGVEAARALAPFGPLARVAFGQREGAELAFEALCTELLAPAALPAVAHVTLVEHADGTPLSAVVTCESNGSGYYLLAFNPPEALKANANRLALWQAMLAARSRGVRWFLLGSLDEGTGKAAAISRFKQQFGGTVMLAPSVEWCLRPRQEAALRWVERLSAHARRRLRLLSHPGRRAPREPLPPAQE